MKQVVQSTRSGKLALRTVPPPALQPGCLMVRTLASLISAGTDRSSVGFAKKNLFAKARLRPDLVRKTLAKVRRDGANAAAKAVLARLDEPLPLGYSAAGIVAEVGAGLEGRFRPGQRVAIAGAGIANHAELNSVPGNLAAVVPEGVADDEACYATLAAVALHGVRQTRSEIGAWCAVVGVGLVGQLAVQLLSLSGVRVLALDFDADRLRLAQQLGAEVTCDLASGEPEAVAFEATRGLGCDAVLIAAATESSTPFETAGEVARDRAIVSLVGNSGTAFPYREFMRKELTVVASRSYGPGRYDADYERRGLAYPPGFVRWTETENILAALHLMRPERHPRLDVGPLTTHRFSFEQAEDAYEMVIAGGEPHLGVVLQYEPSSAPSPPPPPPPRQAASGGCVLGVLGGGAFARGTLLPLLAKMPNCELRTLVTAHGVSAEHGQRRFGFAHAATDEDAVFDDPAINTVIVATPHRLHAGQAMRALASDKHVFVEKPLALTRPELIDVAAAGRSSSAFFQVGFNRRFAPLAVQAKASLDKLPGRRHILLRVNAGQLPAGSWQRDADQGHGRLLGEACHFIDLGAYLAGAPIAAVRADATIADDLCEDATIAAELADGSLVTVFYTALGDLAHGKELIEVYAAGSVVKIEDFRRLVVVAGGRQSKARGNQDKGHKAELQAFVDAAIAGGPAPVAESSLVNSSLASIAALESLASGERIRLDTL